VHSGVARGQVLELEVVQVVRRHRSGNQPHLGHVQVRRMVWGGVRGAGCGV
jgi:hypothetical protein